MIEETLAPSSRLTANDASDTFDAIAAWLYGMASMLVGEGEDSAQLVEAAIANADFSSSFEAGQAGIPTRKALCEIALDVLTRRDPGNLAAPVDLQHAVSCIGDDELDAGGVSSEELQQMLAGPELDRVRSWLEGLTVPMRTIFVLRAVAGFSAADTAAMLETHGGPDAAAWSAEAVRELFRQALCSLATHVLQEVSR
jgi:hypothetical protein